MPLLLFLLFFGLSSAILLLFVWRNKERYDETGGVLFWFLGMAVMMLGLNWVQALGFLGPLPATLAFVLLGPLVLCSLVAAIFKASNFHFRWNLRLKRTR